MLGMICWFLHRGWNGWAAKILKPLTGHERAWKGGELNSHHWNSIFSDGESTEALDRLKHFKQGIQVRVGLGTTRVGQSYWLSIQTLHTLKWMSTEFSSTHVQSWSIMCNPVHWNALIADRTKSSWTHPFLQLSKPSRTWRIRCRMVSHVERRTWRLLRNLFTTEGMSTKQLSCFK